MILTPLLSLFLDQSISKGIQLHYGVSSPRVHAESLWTTVGAAIPMNNQSIYIYRLVSPSRLIEAQEQLGQLLFQVKPGDHNRQLYVSSTSGCFHFVDSEKLWANAGGHLPQSAEQAEALARKFIETSNKRISGSALRSLGCTAIFPTDARLTLAQPVFAQEGNIPDHWLCSFIGYQPTGLLDSTAPAGAAPQKTAPVLGAQVDIRIGAGLEVVGVWSSWRPIRAIELVESLPAPSESTLVYQGGGHDEPQEILSPYYLIPGDDNDTARIFPASRYSLLIRISREDNQESTRLSAEVTGNAGPLTYFWGAWRLDTDSVGQFENLGTSTSIQLPSGAYNVVLDVEDQLTNAFARLQCMAYCGPAASSK